MGKTYTIKQLLRVYLAKIVFKMDGRSPGGRITGRRGRMGDRGGGFCPAAAAHRAAGAAALQGRLRGARQRTGGQGAAVAPLMDAGGVHAA